MLALGNVQKILLENAKYPHDLRSLNQLLQQGGPSSEMPPPIEPCKSLLRTDLLTERNRHCRKSPSSPSILERSTLYQLGVRGTRAGFNWLTSWLTIIHYC